MSLIENNWGAVTGRYAALLLDYLRTQGIDPVALYSAQRIAKITAANGSTQVPAAEYLAMLETAVAATADPDLGLKVGISIQPRHLGVVGYILMCCADMAEALAQYDRYVRLVHGIGRPLVVRRGNTVEMPLDWPEDSIPPPALAQLIMTTRARMGRLLTGHDEKPFDVSFQFARPRDAGLYEKFFGGRVRFAQRRTRLSFPAAYLQLPIMMADAEMSGVIRAQAEALLRGLTDEPEFLRALKAALSQGMVVGRAAAADAAAALGISSRTLHRRLEQYNCAFREVLDGIRRERAEHYLSKPQPTLAEVAFMLGYTEQSAFQHAFKRWTGLTPGNFRLRALGA
ncbi:MAG: AraC family transcriptional regulator [Stenotrophobium sp.]